MVNLCNLSQCTDEQGSRPVTPELNYDKVAKGLLVDHGLTPGPIDGERDLVCRDPIDPGGQPA